MTVNEPSSPVCYASEADDIYMGFAGREEILAALHELLEAEPAGARVALASTKSANDPDYAELMRSVRADEARWCAMLSRQIRRLGAAPSRKTGAFYKRRWQSLIRLKGSPFSTADKPGWFANWNL